MFCRWCANAIVAFHTHANIAHATRPTVSARVRATPERAIASGDMKRGGCGAVQPVDYTGSYALRIGFVTMSLIMSLQRAIGAI